MRLRMNKRLKTMIHVAMLVAVEVVLSRFCSISTQFGKIGFSFLPIAVCGMLFGPWWACLTGGVSDFIGAVLFPIGPYFPGFTISNALTGLLFGLFLYRRDRSWKRILAAAVTVNFGISLLLSTYWLHLLYGSSYFGLLPTRLAQAIMMTALEFVLIRAVQRPVLGYASSLKIN